MSSNALAPAPVSKVGPTKHWARDFSFVGAVTGLAAPLAVAPSLFGSGFIMGAAIGGAATGALLGAIVPRVLTKLGGVPVPLLTFGGVGVGAAWGASVGAIAALALGVGSEGLAVSMTVAGMVGALQFGWLWLPYLLNKIGKRKTWPLLATATVIAPILAFIATFLFDFLF